MDKKITIEFIGKDICDFIEVEEKISKKLFAILLKIFK